MLKSLALVLLVTAAACKSSDAPAPSAQAPASDTPAAPGGPKPRSGKIDLPQPQRPPSLPGAQAAEEGKAGDGDTAADDRRVRRRERMMTIDTDGDGEISDEEREAARKRREANMVARLDTDGDGKVSEQERAEGRRQRADAMRTRLDANGDGKVTADELGANRRFRSLDMQTADTNRDGDISAAELETALGNLPQRARQRRWAGSGAEEPAE
jgi:Ca2+-binding EF-hand superfamily protein